MITVHVVLRGTDPIGAHIEGVATRGLQREGPAANAVARLQDKDLDAGLVQLGRRTQPLLSGNSEHCIASTRHQALCTGKSRADNDNIGL